MSIAARCRAALLLAASMLLCVLPVTTTQAAVVGTGELLQLESSSQRAASDALLVREDLQRQFEEMGVDPAAAAARLRRLSDEEIAALHEQLDSLPAGAMDGVTVALIVFIVFVVTDVIGATDIFPFIRPVQR